MGFENWCILGRDGKFYITNEYKLSNNYSLVIEPLSVLGLARCESTWVKHRDFRISFWFSLKFREDKGEPKEDCPDLIGFWVLNRFGVTYYHYVWSNMYFSIIDGNLHFDVGELGYYEMDVKCDTLNKDELLGQCPNYNNNTWGFVWFDVCNPEPHIITVEGYIVPCVENPNVNNPPYDKGIRVIRCVGKSMYDEFIENMGYGIGLHFENWTYAEYKANLIIDYIQIQTYEYV